MKKNRRKQNRARGGRPVPVQLQPSKHKKVLKQVLLPMEVIEQVKVKKAVSNLMETEKDKLVKIASSLSSGIGNYDAVIENANIEADTLIENFLEQAGIQTEDFFLSQDGTEAICYVEPEPEPVPKEEVKKDDEKSKEETKTQPNQEVKNEKERQEDSGRDAERGRPDTSNKGDEKRSGGSSAIPPQKDKN